MEVRICIGSACHLNGSYDVIKAFEKLIEESKVSEQIELRSSFCLGKCKGGVSVQVDQGEIYGLKKSDVDDFFRKHVIGEIL